MMAKSPSVIANAEFAAALPSEFPAVKASADSWSQYARASCQWMEYAGLIRLWPNGMTRIEDGETDSRIKLLSGAVPVRVRSTFPRANPGPAVQLLRHLAAPSVVDRPAKGGFERAVRDLSLLGVVTMDARGHISLVDPALVKGGAVDQTRLRTSVESQPGMSDAFSCLEADPARAPQALGEAHRQAHKADWASSTTTSVGKFIRAWARECGIATKMRARR